MATYPSVTTFGQYNALAALTDQFQGKDARSLAMQGILGETGGVLSLVKKHQRDRWAFEAYRADVLEELGDTLWYLASVARHSGSSIIEVAQRLPENTFVDPIIGDDIPFAALYDADLIEDYEEDPEYMEELVRFGADVGFLLSLNGPNEFEIREQLSAILARMLHVAHLSGLSMERIATSNVEKILRRWPTPEYAVFNDTFDDAAPDYERIPQALEITISEIRQEPESYFVLNTIRGVHVGDRITDNIQDPDDYRFHDVFHYAFAAVLHWSPVTRALLRLKRKYDKSKDENQDGARAAIIEEAVSAFIFSRAKEQGYFEGVTAGTLSYDLLKAIRGMVRGYEVEACPEWLWERAILQGYAAFRFLQKHRTAILTLDRTTRQLTVEAAS